MAGVALDFTAVPIALTFAGVFSPLPGGAAPASLTLSASFDVLFSGDSVDINVPILSVLSEGGYEHAPTEITLTVLSVSSVGYLENIGTVSIDIPKWIIGTEAPDVYGSGDILLKSLVVTAVGLAGIIGTGSIYIPMWTYHPVAYIVPEGTVSLTVPTWIAEAYGYRSLPNSKVFCMNLGHYAVTEFGRYGFNSMAVFNDKLIGADSSGIYEAQGKKDSSADIDASFMLAMTDMHSEVFKRAREVWLEVRSDGDLALVVRVSEGAEYEYDILQGSGAFEKQREVRAKVGRGISDRYVEFGLRNKSGSYFEIKSMRLKSDPSRKRVR